MGVTAAGLPLNWTGASLKETTLTIFGKSLSTESNMRMCEGIYGYVWVIYTVMIYT